MVSAPLSPEYLAALLFNLQFMVPQRAARIVAAQQQEMKGGAS
jgi:hypothetical protein